MKYAGRDPWVSVFFGGFCPAGLRVLVPEVQTVLCLVCAKEFEAAVLFFYVEADLFPVVFKFCGQPSRAGFFHVVDTHHEGVVSRFVVIPEVCVFHDTLKGASVVDEIMDLLHGFFACYMLHAAGVFFCGFAVYTYILQKLGEGFMTVATFFSADASQFCETDVGVFFFCFYIAPCGELLQISQHFSPGHLHPPADLRNGDPGVLFCKRTELFQHVFFGFSFGRGHAVAQFFCEILIIFHGFSVLNFICICGCVSSD